MSIELPKDAEGREIPLDTAKLSGAGGNAHDTTRWIYTTGFHAGNGRVSACGEGEPPARGVGYRRGDCGPATISIGKCGPKGVGHG